MRFARCADARSPAETKDRLRRSSLPQGANHTSNVTSTRDPGEVPVRPLDKRG